MASLHAAAAVPWSPTYPQTSASLTHISGLNTKSFAFCKTSQNAPSSSSSSSSPPPPPTFKKRSALPLPLPLLPPSSLQSRRSRTIAAAGGGSSEGSAKEEQGGPPEKSKVVRRSKSAAGAAAESARADADVSMVMKAVEERGVSVEGVARVERAAALDVSAALRVAALAGGDIAGILLFSWIGRATHVSAAIDFELVKTADPFIAGWITAAYFLGDYLPEKEPPKGVAAGALSGVKTWALGVPLGIAIRSFIKGDYPQVPFVAVSMVSTLVLLVGWRVAFAAISANQEQTKQSKGGNRQGNPFEFFELLTSLVRRW